MQAFLKGNFKEKKDTPDKPESSGKKQKIKHVPWVEK